MSAVLEFETTNGKYQRVSVIIHWLTVLLMVAIYASIEIHQELQRGTTLRRLTEDWHIYLGLTLIPIVIYRALVILRSPIPPIIPAQANWERLAVKLMKAYLYVLMLGMPLLGWLFLSAEGHAVSWFGIPLPAIAPESDGLAEAAEELHEVLGQSGYVFITLHALAGLYHHYIRKDNTLKRMTL